MTKEQIKNTLKFLERSDMKGGEAPTFMNCIAALNALQNVDEKKLAKLVQSD